MPISSATQQQQQGQQGQGLALDLDSRNIGNTGLDDSLHDGNLLQSPGSIDQRPALVDENKWESLAVALLDHRPRIPLRQPDMQRPLGGMSVRDLGAEHPVAFGQSIERGQRLLGVDGIGRPAFSLAGAEFQKVGMLGDQGGDELGDLLLDAGIDGAFRIRDLTLRHGARHHSRSLTLPGLDLGGVEICGPASR